MLRGSATKHAFLPAVALIIFCLLSLPLTHSPSCWQSENAYLMSVLKARGRPISFKSQSFVCARACVRACVRACLHVMVCVCVCVSVCLSVCLSVVCEVICRTTHMRLLVRAFCTPVVYVQTRKHNLRLFGGSHGAGQRLIRRIC